MGDKLFDICRLGIEKFRYELSDEMRCIEPDGVNMDLYLKILEYSKAIRLCGVEGSGRRTIARALAKRLAQKIEEETGKEVRCIDEYSVSILESDHLDGVVYICIFDRFNMWCGEEMLKRLCSDGKLYLIEISPGVRVDYRGTIPWSNIIEIKPLVYRDCFKKIVADIMGLSDSEEVWLKNALNAISSLRNGKFRKENGARIEIGANEILKVAATKDRELLFAVLSTDIAARLYLQMLQMRNKATPATYDKAEEYLEHLNGLCKMAMKKLS